MGRVLGFALSSDHVERVATNARRDHLFNFRVLIEAALIEAERDEFCLLVIGRSLPAEYSLGGEHAVRE